jgi:hypothetical protein
MENDVQVKRIIIHPHYPETFVSKGAILNMAVLRGYGSKNKPIARAEVHSSAKKYRELR